MFLCILFAEVSYVHLANLFAYSAQVWKKVVTGQHRMHDRGHLHIVRTVTCSPAMHTSFGKRYIYIYIKIYQT